MEATSYCFIPIFLFLLAAFFKIYLKLSTGWCKSHTCLVDKTAIITGANTGIGYETALDFAKRGARVILACRNREKGEEARRRITEETGNGNVVVKQIDMSSFDSVRAFAKTINEEEDRLDILVNNAGATGLGNNISGDGVGLSMQTNYYSSFLLTLLLSDLLKKSTPSRVVNVASMVAKWNRQFNINRIDELSSDREHYANAKLCNILFTRELRKRLRGTGVTTYSLHPGVVSTDMFNNLEGWLRFVLNMIAKTAEEGAQTTIYCSVEKGIEKYDGEHFVDCQRVEPYPTARDLGLAKKLWEKSEAVVGLGQNEILFE